jgi:hypothetical protein
MPHLALLNQERVLAQVYMTKPLEYSMKGDEHTPQHRPGREVLIIEGRKLAEMIHWKCVEYCLKKKKCMGHRMDPLPNHRVGPALIFFISFICLLNFIK